MPGTKQFNDRARVTINNCFRKVFVRWGIFSVSKEFVSRGLTTWDAMRRKAIYSLYYNVWLVVTVK